MPYRLICRQLKSPTPIPSISEHRSPESDSHELTKLSSLPIIIPPNLHSRPVEVIPNQTATETTVKGPIQGVAHSTTRCQKKPRTTLDNILKAEIGNNHELVLICLIHDVEWFVFVCFEEIVLYSWYNLIDLSINFEDKLVDFYFNKFLSWPASD